MSHWNHRVIKKVTEIGTFYGIHEVFYNDDGSIYSYTENPVDVFGENIAELQQTLEWMLKCLDKPVLVDGEVEFVDYDETD